MSESSVLSFHKIKLMRMFIFSFNISGIKFNICLAPLLFSFS